MATELLTPVGRLVQGSCFEAQTTDAEGNPLVIRNGPNAGKPRVDYFMAIAIPKTDPGWPELWSKISNAARQGFPNMFDANGNSLRPDFAFKVTDGDSQIPNRRGNKPCDREGFPGCWVLAFSGGFPPKCYTPGGQQVLTDPTSIKRGDYIRIYGSVTDNESPNQPGVYLNHSMVERVGFGEEIITGPNGEAVFGGAPVTQLPAGASATPLAPSTTIAGPGQPAQQPGPQMQQPAAQQPGPQMQQPAQQQPGPQMQQPAQQQPGPQMQQPAAPNPTGPVQPAPDFLNPPAQQQQPVVMYRTQDGGTWTYDQLISYNFTPEQINQLPRA